MALEIGNTRLPLSYSGQTREREEVIGLTDPVRKRAEWIFGKPLEELKRGRISPYLESPTKRRVEKAIAMVAVIALAPIIADTLIAASINHRRIALIDVGGEKGPKIKFQTQANNAQKIIARIMEETGENYTQLKKRGALKRVSNWLDLLLRRFSLDELPQLFGVLSEYSTLIGPRLPAPDECDQLDSYIGEEGAEIYRRYVKKHGYGILSVGQVIDRGMNIEDRLELDVAYICNASSGVDARIASQLPRALLFDSGAR